MVAAANNITLVNLRSDITIEQWRADINTVTHIGFTDTAKMMVMDFGSITVRDQDGEIISKTQF